MTSTQGIGMHVEVKDPEQKIVMSKVKIAANLKITKKSEFIVFF